MIRSRDFDYIQDRLLAPAVAATEATERLASVGQGALAERLVTAHQEFLDACRAIRRDLGDIYNRESSELRRGRIP